MKKTGGFDKYKQKYQGKFVYDVNPKQYLESRTQQRDLAK